MAGTVRVQRDIATGHWYLADADGKIVFEGSHNEVVEKMKKEMDDNA